MRFTTRHAEKIHVARTRCNRRKKLQRRPASVSIAALRSVSLSIAYWCVVVAMVLLTTNQATRQGCLFSKCFVTTCNGFGLHTRKSRGTTQTKTDLYRSVAPFHRQPQHISRWVYSPPPYRISRQYDHPYCTLQRQQAYFTTLMMAARNAGRSSASRRSKSKRNITSSKRYSLVVQGPPKFQCPPLKGARPFKLVIVESPSKCQTISKILQQYVHENNLDYDFVLTSSMGHIRDLPNKKTHKDQKIAGIDLNKDYHPTYVVLEGKEGLLSELQELNSYAQQLVLATDDDREGEAMAWHLLQLLQDKRNDNQEQPQPRNHEQEPPIRVRFTEITRKAIIEAIENFETDVQHNLVQAQETRRILDRLAGFTVAPILAKKISPGLSAGRVQSVGMAMIVQRERERLTFQETEYWSLNGNFSSIGNDGNRNSVHRLTEARLVSINGQSIASGTADFNPNQADELALAALQKLHLTEELAANLTQTIETKGDSSWTWKIDKVVSTQRKQNAPLPLITSTLQQEANRRLGMSVSNCMRSAQQLYEKGYISYMRTDSVHLSEDARNAIRTEITKDFGPEKFVTDVSMISGKGRVNKPSKKNSKISKPDPQAAHEAIRPTIQENGRFRKPDELSTVFDTAAIKVYELIYQRTVASHMTSQVSNQTSITIVGENDAKENAKVLRFRTSGSVIIDPGYTAVYPRQVDSKSPILPNFEDGQLLSCDGVSGMAHQTQPPARYTEASFIQELEAKGVGRPSTYASIVQTLRYRSYIGSPVTNASSRRVGKKEVSGPAISAQRAAGGEEFTGMQNANGPLVPSLSAFVVTSLLENHCKMYVDPSFTAKMEERLDKIANSAVEVSENERVSYLNEFYKGDEGLASKIDHIDRFVDADVARRADLPALAWNSTDKFEDIGLFIGPWGPFLKKTYTSSTEGNCEEKFAKAKLPPGMAADISTITLKGIDAILEAKEENGCVLGQHPEDGRMIRLKVGPFGGYLQWGDENDELEATKHTLPREMRNFKMPEKYDEKAGESLAEMIGLDLDIAIKYCSLPRTVCVFNDFPITTAIGPYGPYLKYKNKYVTLKPKDGDVFTVEEETAQKLVIDGIVNKTANGVGVLAEIGKKDGSMITVKTGRFGDYINWNKVNAKLPAIYLDDPTTIPLEEAWDLIQEKSGSTARNNHVDIPLGPKRPKTSYLIFSAEMRPKIAAQFTSLGEIAKELGRLWQNLSDEGKQPYIEQAAVAKAAYEIEKAKWEDETKELRKLSGKKKTTKRSSPNSPKRPRSAYIFFCNINRAKLSKEFGTLGEVSKELSRRWKTLGADGKTEYEIMAKEDKLRYVREKNEHEHTRHPSRTTMNGNSRSSSTLKPEEQQVVPLKKAKMEKRKRAPSAYMLFCASHRSLAVDDNGDKLSLPDTTKMLAQMWRDCNEETRAHYLKEADVKKKELQLLYET